jgi:sterol desaturase/sphingolipid hydroxylase (fatty acid hydroxylase superfamily)
MRLSKTGYYADFIVYPSIILMLSTAALCRTPFPFWIEWSVACLIGIATWTFLEYVFHRIVFHRVQFFAEFHAMHHEDPTGPVGTPTWVSLGLCSICVLFPLWWKIGFDLASGVTAGMMLGYFWYVSLHYVVHHWTLDRDSYLYGIKRRHALHHFAPIPCNFGVTTQFWDRVFGTTYAGRRAR